MKKVFVLFAAATLFVGVQACKQKTEEPTDASEVVDSAAAVVDEAAATVDSAANAVADSVAK